VKSTNLATGLTGQPNREEAVKTIIAIALFTALIMAGPIGAEELQVGLPASDWAFEDSTGMSYSMASWEGKVLLINYVDPDESDLNEHFTDAMKKAKDEGRLKDESYKGIGIADCAATWKPNFAIRAIAGKKAKKYSTTILFDYDASLRNAWELQKDTANAVLLDKKRVCRAIIRGRVPDEKVDELVQLAVDLQSE
jgi:predicted transcriptional regulator